MPYLVFKTGDRKGQSYRLKQENITVGRDPENVLVLSDRRASRCHAQIIMQGKDYIIEDFGAVNTTLVNEKPIKTHTLQINDEIKIGSTIMSFVSRDSVEDVSDDSITNIKIIPQEEDSQTLTIEAKIDPNEVQTASEEILQADMSTMQKAYKRLMTLYYVSDDLGTIFDVPQLLEHILHLVLRIIKADCGLIMFCDEDTGELVLKAVHFRDHQEQAEVPFSKTIAQEVIKTGESILISDATADERFKQADSIIHHDIRSTMCVPIRGKDKIIGVLQLDTKGKVVGFNKEDLGLLTAICQQAAMAIENAKLISGLRQANEEIKQQQSQLIESEKLSAVGRLASGVAHEINNPLTSILGYTELSANQIGQGGLTEEKLKECHDFLKIVIDEAHHCQHIAKELLQFSRKQKDEFKLTDINKVVEASLAIAKFHIKKAPIEIKKETDTNIPQIMANAGQIQQVLLNLIINAKDAMEKGGTIQISSQREDQWIVIKVADTGSGIPEDKIEKIFQPLFTTKEEGKGTGLGLSICQDIVEKHKGRLEVKSVVGQGTTFIIQLPLLENKT